MILIDLWRLLDLDGKIAGCDYTRIKRNRVDLGTIINSKATVFGYTKITNGAF